MVNSSLVNQANAHSGFSLQRGAAPAGPPPTGCGGKSVGYPKPCGIKSYTSLRGGRRSKKRGRRRKRKRRTSRKRSGGSPPNRLQPKKGMREMLTRGKNASRGLSREELKTLHGGSRSQTMVGGKLVKGGSGTTGYQTRRSININTPKKMPVCITRRCVEGGGSTTTGYQREKNSINLYDVDRADPHPRKDSGMWIAPPGVATKLSQNGGGYGFNSKVAAGSFGPNSLGQGYHLKATVPTTGYKNCGIIPDFKMGAGVNYVGTKTIQKGAGPAKYPSNQSMRLMSTDGQNQMANPNYGYTTGKNAAIFAPGHAQVTINNAHEQQCHLNGGKKKKGGNRFFLAMKDKFESVPSEVSKDVDNTIGNAFLGVHAASGGGHTRKRRRSRKRKYRKRRNSRKRKVKRRRRHTKKQRGGYAQFQSNVPLTWTEQQPAGAAGGTWQGQLATPPTYTRTDICHNNYNHYTGKNTPSPILDQAVMASKTSS